MSIIKIVAGTYGHREGGRIVPKTAASGEFEVSDRQAKRLIALKIAEAVTPEVINPVVPPAGAGNTGGSGEEEGYQQMTVKQLKQLCEERGLELDKRAKKTDIIALLVAADEEESGDEDGEGAAGAEGDGEPPALDPADPVL